MILEREVIPIMAKDARGGGYVMKTRQRQHEDRSVCGNNAGWWMVDREQQTVDITHT
jgi:hypothetical protein